MKKFISTILMIVSIVTSIAVLAACGNRGGDTSGDDLGGRETDGEPNEHKDDDFNGLCDACNFTVKAPTTFTVNLTGTAA